MGAVHAAEAAAAVGVITSSFEGVVRLAMRMQAELFHQHRLTCAAALKLHTPP